MESSSVVEPFSEVSAIQLVMDKPVHASYDPSMLPDHLQDMLNLTSENLDNVQRGYNLQICSQCPVLP